MRLFLVAVLLYYAAEYARADQILRTAGLGVLALYVCYTTFSRGD
jgi:hypothetical protein